VNPEEQERQLREAAERVLAAIPRARPFGVTTMPDLLHRGLAALRPDCRSCAKLADAYWGRTPLCAVHWLEAHDWLEQHLREARERADEVWARIVVLMLLVAAAAFVLAVLW
jgi:hypothetical protein